MDRDKLLREHVLYLLRGGGAHLDFDTAVADLPVALRGARPTGVDVTPAQLESARRCQDRSGITFPLAETGDVPLPSGSFDLAVSECGASLWCDPAR